MTNAATWQHRVAEGIRTLSPAYFALPMSTGIIALASDALGHGTAGRVFFALNNVEYATLAVLYILRLTFFFPQFRNDLAAHRKGAGFLTIVAASCLLGQEYAHFPGNHAVATAFWVTGLITWLFFAYTFFILVTVRAHKPSLERGINGTWLLFVVSVQALAILACTNVLHWTIPPRTTLFTALLFHLLGWLFYLVFIGIIFYRTIFTVLRANEFEPSYWINMGAAAITSLAGSTLAETLDEHALWTELVPTLKVLTVFAWIAGVWWIPVVFVVGLWRLGSVPVRYQPGYWSMVFPLGMYTLCTWHLAGLFNVPLLKDISPLFIWVAWGAWLVTAIGMWMRIGKVYLLGR